MRRVFVTMAVALAISVAAAPAVSAETGGFFTIGNDHASISGSESGAHQLTFAAPGLEGEISCTASYQATSTATTVESLFFAPIYSECTGASIDTNGCGFTFKVAEAPTKETEQTLHLVCPVGKNLTITRPDCTIALPPQYTIGMTYEKASILGFDALTLNIDTTLAFQYEAGKCTSLGTSQLGTFEGSLTVNARNTAGELVDISVNWDESSRHFISGTEHPTIVGSESGGHSLHFTHDGGEGEIGCESPTYSLTATEETAQVTVVEPVVEGCATTGGAEVLVLFNGCSLRFRVVKGTASETEQNVALTCPAGSAVSVLHPNCTIAIPPQEVLSAATYTTVEEDGDHALTLDVDARFNVRFEGGICKFLGTNHTGAVEGSVLVKAFDTAGEQVDLTAT